jgi:lysophospholipid acyltransferase (LPLAT)-like uncharacterized protein
MKEDLHSKKAFLMAHWHGDELALVCLAPRYRLATITSTSKDGELMNSVLKWLGVKTSRGSSTRGGISALKGLLRLAKDGRNCSFAVDGPKGPLHKVKPGIFEVSRMMEGRIYVAGVACNRAWVFSKSWNKAYLPKPFARIYVHWSGPFGPVQRDEDPRSPALAENMESKLHSAKQQAIKVIAEYDA